MPRGSNLNPRQLAAIHQPVKQRAPNPEDPHGIGEGQELHVAIFWVGHKSCLADESGI